MFKVIKVAALGVCCLAAAACQVEKTQDGKLPEVSVDATGGALPKYDVQGPEVKVGTKTTTIEVPTVEVKTPAEKK